MLILSFWFRATGKPLRIFNNNVKSVFSMKIETYRGLAVFIVMLLMMHTLLSEASPSRCNFLVLHIHYTEGPQR